MPKTKTRKRGNVGRSPAQKQASSVAPADTTSDVPVAQAKSRSARAAKKAAAKGWQNLAMTTMVALGCWGMSVSFVFFTTDPNRYVYGGMAAVMAALWTGMFGMQLRKALQK